jgi:hypothetical protein
VTPWWLCLAHHPQNGDTSGVADCLFACLTVTPVVLHCLFCTGGDRGGVADLINTIKSSKIPIICICNDKYSQVCSAGEALQMCQALEVVVMVCKHLLF